MIDDVGKWRTQQCVLKLEIPFSVHALTFAVSLTAEAEKVLGDSGYDEGRYPFHREMIGRGLREELEYCVRASVEEYFRRKYPHNHTTTSPDGRSQYNTAHAEASRYLKDNFRGVSLDVGGMKGSVELASDGGDYR